MLYSFPCITSDPDTCCKLFVSPLSYKVQAELPATAAMDACLELLRGERDEQRLAGLLLVTKFCNKDDHSSIRTVYDAVGDRFLTRLLCTGLGKGSSGAENRDAYLELAASLLASFCRVPDIAASDDMVSKIPLILEIMSNNSGSSSLVDECYEILFLVANGHKDGIRTLYESGGMNALAIQMPTLVDGSHTVELALRLAQVMMTNIPPDIFYNKYPSELSKMAVTLARQFAILHNALKFELLHFLSTLLSSQHSAPVRDALCRMKNDMWSNYIRVGVVAILQNRTAPVENIYALTLAESVISIVGNEWLIGQMNLPDIDQEHIPADRCILLILESSRVEIAVLLNDLAYMKYEASKNSTDSNSILSKQRNLCIAFSLVEKVIKLIASVAEDESGVIRESSFIKIINGLNETTGVILEFLQDAKDHGQRKGDDLLASVRIIGSYLAETPLACKEKVMELLDFMLLIEGEDEPSPFYSICFLLPLLYQMTLEVDGCQVMASSGSYKAVVECLIKLVGVTGDKDMGLIFLACDTLMNILLKKEQIRGPLYDAGFVELLGALSSWTEVVGDNSVIMMVSSICALILDFTSEDALQQHPDFDGCKLTSLSRLIRRSLTISGQDSMSEDAKGETDLYEIVLSGYSRWAERFPQIKRAVGR